LEFWSSWLNDIGSTNHIKIHTIDQILFSISYGVLCNPLVASAVFTAHCALNCTTMLVPPPPVVPLLPTTHHASLHCLASCWLPADLPIHSSATLFSPSHSVFLPPHMTRCHHLSPFCPSLWASVPLPSHCCLFAPQAATVVSSSCCCHGTTTRRAMRCRCVVVSPLLRVPCCGHVRCVSCPWPSTVPVAPQAFVVPGHCCVSCVALLPHRTVRATGAAVFMLPAHRCLSCHGLAANKT